MQNFRSLTALNEGGDSYICVSEASFKESWRTFLNEVLMTLGIKNYIIDIKEDVQN